MNKHHMYILIKKFGSRGVSYQELKEETRTKITPKLRRKLVDQLKNEGKIFFSVSSCRYKLIEFKTEQDKESLEWMVT